MKEWILRLHATHTDTHTYSLHILPKGAFIIATVTEYNGSFFFATIVNIY